MNAPKLRFEGFNEDWQSNKLEEIILAFRLGGNYSNSEENTGFSLIKMGNVDRGNIKLDKVEYIASGQAIDIKDELKFGDLLFNTRNTLDLVGKVAIWRNELPVAFYNSNLMSMQFPDNFFMNYRFNSFQTLKLLKSVATGTTSVAAIYGKDLFQLYVKILTLPEQTKIANFLTAIDDKITQLSQKAELLTQYKKGVMQQIFSQKLRFKDDDGREFGDWEENKGNFLFEVISNKKHNSDLPILAITQEFGAIPRDLIDYQVSVSDKSVESYKVVEIGDFIISLRSFQGGIEYSDYKGICSPAYIILRPKIELNRKFYKFYLKT